MNGIKQIKIKLIKIAVVCTHKSLKRMKNTILTTWNKRNKWDELNKKQTIRNKLNKWNNQI